MQELYSNNHSVFNLHYHLIMVTKYRKKLFDNTSSDFARDVFVRIAEKHGVELVEWNHDIDHVHVLFRAKPNTNLSKFINAYKSASSRLIKKTFPDIANKLWNGIFWSRSYCLLSCGGAPIQTIKRYIESQGRK